MIEYASPLRRLMTIQDPRRMIISTTTRRSVTQVLTIELMPYRICRKPIALRIDRSFLKKKVKWA
jgi:hypothetical protein